VVYQEKSCYCSLVALIILYFQAYRYHAKSRCL